MAVGGATAEEAARYAAVRVTLHPARPAQGRIDAPRVDATTEADLRRHAAEHDGASSQHAAAYTWRARRRTGLTQAAFAERIGVPLDTVRNWAQAKRLPAGPAKALLRILDRAPEPRCRRWRERRVSRAEGDVMVRRAAGPSAPICNRRNYSPLLPRWDRPSPAAGRKVGFFQGLSAMRLKSVHQAFDSAI